MSTSSKTDSDATSEFKYYLPGSPDIDSQPGRLARFVRRLLRRRGTLVPVARRRKFE